MPNAEFLTQAKKGKNDEFYTQYEDIQKEMNAYIEYNPDTFRDKVILLPCDDPEWSNFTKFLHKILKLLASKSLLVQAMLQKAKTKICLRTISFLYQIF